MLFRLTRASVALVALSLLGGACDRSQRPADPCARRVEGDDAWGGGITVPGAGCLFTRAGASAPEPGSPSLGAAPTPWGIHLGVLADPTTSLAITWRTDDNTTLASTVEFGESGSAVRSLEGYTFTFGREGYRVHEAWLTGLRPGTRYTYRVGGRDARTGLERWSEVATFRTAPAPGMGPPDVDLLLIGDTRDALSHYALWGKLLGAAAAQGPLDLILFSGDAVTLGSFQSEWDDFLRVAEPVLRRVPIVMAHGNHEANQVNFFSLFALPGGEEYFGVDWGPVHVTVLNDSPWSYDDIFDVAAPFLESDLRAHQGAPWKLLLHHRPLFSAGTTHGSDAALQRAFGPAIDRYHVDLVLNGHDHDYQRTRPLRAGLPVPSPREGTTYVVAGSAGAPLYDYLPADFLAAAARSYSYVLIRVRGGLIDLSAYDDLGNTIDRFGWSKGPPRP